LGDLPELLKIVRRTEEKLPVQTALCKFMLRRAMRAVFRTTKRPGFSLNAFMDLGSGVDLIKRDSIYHLTLSNEIISAKQPLKILSWDPSKEPVTTQQQIRLEIIPDPSDTRFLVPSLEVTFWVVQNLYEEEDLVLSDVTMMRLGCLAGARLLTLPSTKLEEQIADMPEPTFNVAIPKYVSPQLKHTNRAYNTLENKKVPEGTETPHPKMEDLPHNLQGMTSIEVESFSQEVTRRMLDTNTNSGVENDYIPLSPQIFGFNDGRIEGDIQDAHEYMIPPKIRIHFKKKVKELLTEYSDLLGHVPKEPNEKLKSIPLFFEVDEKKLKPQAHRNHNPRNREIINKTVDEWIKKGYAVKTDQAAFMQCTVQTKPNGKHRVCLDGRSVNDAIVGEANFPLPDIRTTVRRAASAKFRSKVDLTEAFFQLCLHILCQKYCTGSTGTGGYNFMLLKLFFGHKFATHYFQWVITKVLQKCSDFAASYVDDIIIFTHTTVDDHLEHIRAVFQCMREYELRFAPQKCVWLSAEMTFLGFTISDNGYHVDYDFVTNLIACDKPKTVKQLQSFLGKINWIKQFLVGPVTEHEKILREMIKTRTKDRPSSQVGRLHIDWEEKYEQSYEKLKSLTTYQISLAPLHNDRLTFIETDASDTGMGAILFQKDTLEAERRFMCAMWSKPFTAVEQQWPTGCQELYAAISAMLRFRDWLSGRHFICYTDNMNLVTGQFKDAHFLTASLRIQRAIIRLQEFNVTFVWVKGENNVGSDYLSRQFPKLQQPLAAMPLEELEEVNSDTLCANNCAAVDQVKKLRSLLKTNECEIVDQVRAIQSLIIDPTTPYTERHPRHDVPSPSVQSMVDPPTTNELITTPIQVGPIISMCHNSMVGHLGVAKTTAALRERGFTWPCMQENVQQFVAACPTCQRTDQRRSRVVCDVLPHGGELGTNAPFELVAMDTVGPYCDPNNRNDNYKYILVFVDHFTKFVHLEPIVTLTAPEAAGALLKFVCLFGIPEAFKADNGTQFANCIMRNLATQLGFKWQNAIPYRHESNGVVERMNKEVVRHLRVMLCEKRLSRKRIHELLPLVTRIINSTKSNATGYEPITLLFAGRLKPDRMLLPPKTNELYSWGKTSGDYLKQLQSDYKTLIRKSLDYQRTVLNHRHKMGENIARNQLIPKDTKVWVKDSRNTNKFNPGWLGPYTVNQQVEPTQTSVHLTPIVPEIQRPIPMTHRSHIKLCVDAPELGFTAKDLKVPEVDQWETQKIVGHHRCEGQSGDKNLLFKIRWVGFEATSDSLLSAPKVNSDLKHVYLHKLGKTNVNELEGTTLVDDEYRMLPIDG
jgi:hypothetical protein